MNEQEREDLIRLALSNLLYRERILEGDEGFMYWVERLMLTTTAMDFERKDI